MIESENSGTSVMVPLYIFIGVSALLTCGGIALMRKYEWDPPPTVVLAWYSFIIVILTGLTLPTAFAISHGLDAIANVCLVLLIAFVPIGVMVGPAAKSIGDLFATSLFDSSIVSPPPSAFGRARKKAIQGDIDDALREYDNYFKENTEILTPLFAAALLLRKEERYSFAAKYYLRIMNSF